jgi:hypothetical protein
VSGVSRKKARAGLKPDPPLKLLSVKFYFCVFCAFLRPYQ